MRPEPPYGISLSSFSFFATADVIDARASGIDRTDGDEVVCLTPDEMSEATRRRWEEGATRGAVIFVLLKRADREGDACGAKVEGARVFTVAPKPRIARRLHACAPVTQERGRCAQRPS